MTYPALENEIKTYEKRSLKSGEAHLNALERLPLGVGSNYRFHPPYPLFVPDANGVDCARYVPALAITDAGRFEWGARVASATMQSAKGGGPRAVQSTGRFTFNRIMKPAFLILAALICLGFTAAARAAEPLVATWQLEHQELNGEKRETEPLILRVSADGDKLLFAFSVPVNNISFVSLSYTAKLDGTEADVKNARGTKVGTVQITRPSASHYIIIMKGENRPDTTVLLTVSADGNALTSESHSMQSGKPVRLVQTFSRH